MPMLMLQPLLWWPKISPPSRWMVARLLIPGLIRRQPLHLAPLLLAPLCPPLHRSLIWLPTLYPARSQPPPRQPRRSAKACLVF